MNSPYGSFEHLTDWSGYGPGWESTPSTDEDFHFDNDSFALYTGNFVPFPTPSTWPPATSQPSQAASHAQQYDFQQGQQVWAVLATPMHGPSHAGPFSRGGHQHSDAELMYRPHNGAIAAASAAPPTAPASHQHCTHPRDTTAPAAQCPAVSPESIQHLFPSPALPRSEPPRLYDDDGQPLQTQQPRFDGDLYTALWIRGEGVSRAGWCGFCASWHKLKDSAYWYHLHYTHGIAYNSGRPLEPPRQLRWSRSANVLEALCGGCDEWVSIGKGVKVRTAYWRHAYKCLTRGSPRRAPAVPDL